MKALFSEHIEKRLKDVVTILNRLNIDNLYIESGFPEYYYMDDQPTFFKTNPYFNFFCPDMGVGHLLKIESSGKKPKLYFYIPDDFWHETSSLKGEFWEDFFEVKVFNNTHAIWKEAQESNKNNVILSPNPSVALEYSCKNADDSLINALHWTRAQKTEYEVECIKEANKKASLGHKKAMDLFYQGAGEMTIFMEYLIASGQKESDLPYNSIVALDAHSAVLHYQFPKKTGSGHTFLIDAGARYNGYCSDITRTYCTEKAPNVFKDILSKIQESQTELCDLLRPGTAYTDVHKRSFLKVAHILLDSGLFKGSLEQALEHNLPLTFYPHGVGHPLGLQVHDVGAKQVDSSGKIADQPAEFPYLRTLRTIQENDVLTIEPGFYFIPMLLEKLKDNSQLSSLMNWKLIEELTPFGGIRIEDNVVARKESSENLTRLFLP